MAKPDFSNFVNDFIIIKARQQGITYMYQEYTKWIQENTPKEWKMLENQPIFSTNIARIPKYPPIPYAKSS